MVMNVKPFLVFTISAFFALGVSAQNILNAGDPSEIGVKTKEQIEKDNDRPLEYGYVDDRDVLWAKTTWEAIDLDERVNFPLYYPIDTSNIGSDRRSLYNVLISAIKSNKLKNVYADSYFTEKRTLKDLQATIRKVDTTDLGIEQLNAGEAVSSEFIESRELEAQDIAEYHVKGLWYFDKRQGELKYRLLGIAPVAPDVNFIDDEEPDLVALFWCIFLMCVRYCTMQKHLIGKTHTNLFLLITCLMLDVSVVLYIEKIMSKVIEKLKIISMTMH